MQPDQTPLLESPPETEVAIMERSPQVNAEPMLPQQLKMTRSVWNQIEKTVGKARAEQGGLLGGDRETGIVERYYYDRTAHSTGVTYSPNYQTLNRLLTEKWNPAGINLLGFVHSHPRGIHWPSGGDLIYARAILKCNPAMPYLLLPIVFSKPDAGQFQMFCYAAVRDKEDVRIQALKLVVVEDTGGEGRQSMAPELSTRHETAAPTGLKEGADQVTPTSPSLPPTVENETFRRVRDAYDLPRLQRCRVIYVGVGGAAAFAEDLVRAGVGEHILIDPDTVSETNLATQQTYRRDIDRLKVDALAERLQDINPDARILAIPKLLDAIGDEEFASLIRQPLSAEDPMRAPDAEPIVTLLCGLTDNFYAQARVNRLALQFGIPSLCAQVYTEGRAAEVTFTYPGITSACHRCILSSRYRAYLDQSFTNNVTSDGTPIFSTTRLNALKGYIVMALLHHGMEQSVHPPKIEEGTESHSPAIVKASYRRWGGLLERIGNRNLIQIRMDPDFALGAFKRVFGAVDSANLLCDDVVWLPQEPEGGQEGEIRCPDCGGSGDLQAARGMFEDTRILCR